jgi:hypothetical protein
MASISLQDLRRRLYIKAKADKDWRFWGLYVHVAKLETLRAAYDLAHRNNGAPGIGGVTFEAIEAAGVEALLVQLQDETVPSLTPRRRGAAASARLRPSPAAFARNAHARPPG